MSKDSIIYLTEISMILTDTISIEMDTTNMEAVMITTATIFREKEINIYSRMTTMALKKIHLMSTPKQEARIIRTRIRTMKAKREARDFKVDLITRETQGNLRMINLKMMI